MVWRGGGGGDALYSSLSGTGVRGPRIYQFPLADGGLVLDYFFLRILILSLSLFFYFCLTFIQFSYFLLTLLLFFYFLSKSKLEQSYNTTDHKANLVPSSDVQ